MRKNIEKMNKNLNIRTMEIVDIIELEKEKGTFIEWLEKEGIKSEVESIDSGGYEEELYFFNKVSYEKNGEKKAVIEEFTTDIEGKLNDKTTVLIFKNDFSIHDAKEFVFRYNEYMKKEGRVEIVGLSPNGYFKSEYEKYDDLMRERFKKDINKMEIIFAKKEKKDKNGFFVSKYEIMRRYILQRDAVKNGKLVYSEAFYFKEDFSDISALIYLRQHNENKRKEKKEKEREKNKRIKR